MRRRGIVLAAVWVVGIGAPSLLSPASGGGDGRLIGNVYAAPSLPSPRGGGLMNAAINSPYVADAMTTQQYHLTASDGRTWKDIDPVNLSITLNSPGDISVILMANADLWPANAGYNQDLGIAVSGGVTPNKHPTAAGQPEAWK